MLLATEMSHNVERYVKGSTEDLHASGLAAGSQVGQHRASQVTLGVPIETTEPSGRCLLQDGMKVL